MEKITFRPKNSIPSRLHNKFSKQDLEAGKYFYINQKKMLYKVNGLLYTEKEKYTFIDIELEDYDPGTVTVKVEHKFPHFSTEYGTYHIPLYAKVEHFLQDWETMYEHQAKLLKEYEERFGNKLETVTQLDNCFNDIKYKFVEHLL